MDPSTSRSSGNSGDSTVQSMTRDRLSELPELALVRILSHLNTVEAAKTTVLSKRFNSLWNSVDSLSFSVEVSRNGGVVDTALGFHRRELIEKFSLSLSYISFFKLSVDQWLSFAVQKQVKSVHLNFNELLRGCMRWVRGFTYTLPETLYNNMNLVELVTSYCVFPTQKKISCSRLKLLSMTRIPLSTELISEILSGCNVLETLELKYCKEFDKLMITSSSLKVLRIVGEQSPDFFMQQGDEIVLDILGPNLVSLEVSDILYRTKLRLVDLRSLVNAVVTFTIMPQGSSRGFDIDWVAARDREIARHVLQSLCFVETVTVGGSIFKALSTREAYDLSPSARRCLTICIPITEWSHFGICSLLYSSPNLESLAIRLSYCSDTCDSLHDDVPHVDGDNDENFWKSRDTISKCPLLILKTVKIFGFQASCRSMTTLFQFLEFLLTNSPILQVIVIKASRNVTRATIDEAIKLCSLQTASPDVLVKFEPPHLWVDPVRSSLDH